MTSRLTKKSLVVKISERNTNHLSLLQACGSHLAPQDSSAVLL